MCTHVMYHRSNYNIYIQVIYNLFIFRSIIDFITCGHRHIIDLPVHANSLNVHNSLLHKINVLQVYYIHVYRY